jgi:hypothetical protein
MQAFGGSPHVTEGSLSGQNGEKERVPDMRAQQYALVLRRRA